MVVEKIRGTARLWMMREHLVFESKVLAGLVVLPAGSIIDFASTPRFLWSILPPSGQYDWGTALHDGGYRRQLRAAHFETAPDGLPIVVLGPTMTLVRHLCDDLMDEANEAMGVDRRERMILYRGVQLFGGEHYHGMEGLR